MTSYPRDVHDACLLLLYRLYVASEPGKACGAGVTAPDERKAEQLVELLTERFSNQAAGVVWAIWREGCRVDVTARPA